ncbi:uncharacterized protein LOC111023870 [Momordica charantia]|uniref:Uncharacterized protein LOC111023870 n=1 Tax=Momordica charantia TaxID=3673 RepID=A0A6J1DVE9_MOMCH|nr:uncharacterized protein LOC111023870 [Momordica charantia]
MGNGSISKVRGIGDVGLKTGEGVELVLRGVRYIPSFRFNLLSVGKLETMAIAGSLRQTMHRVATDSSGRDLKGPTTLMARTDQKNLPSAHVKQLRSTEKGNENLIGHQVHTSAVRRSGELVKSHRRISAFKGTGFVSSVVTDLGGSAKSSGESSFKGRWTDKASLLAEVIQHVKELKRQTTLIADVSPVPTELDELSVDVDASDEDGKFVIKASLCCEDRSDLLPQIIKTLKSLHLRTLRAEITTLGGRVKNVLFITGDDDSSSSGDQQEPQHHHQYCITSIQEALKAVMEKVCSEDHSSSGSTKRQRTNNNINIIEHRSL